MTDRLFDEGMQPERTLLAWRRTCLAAAVGAALLVRFGSERLGLFAISLGISALVLVATCYVLAAKRYRRVHRALVTEASLPAAGTLVTLVALVVVIIALTTLAWTAAGA